jgi:hypothetical protein
MDTGSASKAMGLLSEAFAGPLGNARCKRFSMLVEDNVIKVMLARFLVAMCFCGASGPEGDMSLTSDCSYRWSTLKRLMAWLARWVTRSSNLCRLHQEVLMWFAVVCSVADAIESTLVALVYIPVTQPKQRNLSPVHAQSHGCRMASPDSALAYQRDGRLRTGKDPRQRQQGSTLL